MIKKKKLLLADNSELLYNLSSQKDMAVKVSRNSESYQPYPIIITIFEKRRKHISMVLFIASLPLWTVLKGQCSYM